jgi:N4-gp56 family major capsid protein
VAQATGPVAPTVTPATGNVHISYICGSGAFGVTELGRLQTYITPATADKADPLGQFRTAGWKQLFKPVILNTSFFYRIETTSNFN